MKVVIIGGIAAGLSAASQIKRQAPGALVMILEKGVEFFTGVDVDRKDGKTIKTPAGDFTSDLVVAAVGVRPNTELFAAAGGGESGNQGSLNRNFTPLGALWDARPSKSSRAVL